jgi:hypothetical protein
MISYDYMSPIRGEHLTEVVCLRLRLGDREELEVEAGKLGLDLVSYIRLILSQRHGLGIARQFKRKQRKGG